MYCYRAAVQGITARPESLIRVLHYHLDNKAELQKNEAWWKEDIQPCCGCRATDALAQSALKIQSLARPKDVAIFDGSSEGVMG